MQTILKAALTHCQREATPDCGVFQAFPAVYIEDSSYISLCEELAEHFPGSGGNASAASAKVWLTYEYRSGMIHALDLIPGRQPDQVCEIRELAGPAGSLHLFDLGYYSQRRLVNVTVCGDYFVCRLDLHSALYSLDGERINLEALLAAATTDQVEFEALLGAKVRLPVRILAQRLPPEVVEQRRKKTRKDAQRMRRTYSARKFNLLTWNIFCTNVPAQVWSFDQVMAAYPIRWQIELLFKLWKSGAGLDTLGQWRTERTLIQLYARLTGLVLMHYLMAPLRFAGPRELSLPKALPLLQRLVPVWAGVIRSGWHHFQSLLDHLYTLCLRLALKDSRRTDPSTYEILVRLAA